VVESKEDPRKASIAENLHMGEMGAESGVILTLPSAPFIPALHGGGLIANSRLARPNLSEAVVCFWWLQALTADLAHDREVEWETYLLGRRTSICGDSVVIDMTKQCQTL
jgi:hypothetical protein